MAKIGVVMKLSKEDQAFYSGMLTALAVVALHDEETLFREIVATADEKELIWVAKENDEMRWSGLAQYGYGQKKWPLLEKPGSDRNHHPLRRRR